MITKVKICSQFVPFWLGKFILKLGGHVYKGSPEKKFKCSLSSKFEFFLSQLGFSQWSPPTFYRLPEFDDRRLAKNYRSHTLITICQMLTKSRKTFWLCYQGLISPTHVRAAFMHEDPQSAKNQSSCQYLFALLG